MNIRPRNLFILIVFIIFVWFLYLQRQILTPFILALIFAYIFDPLISFFYKYLKLPRTLSIIFVYLILISSVGFASYVFTKSIIGEYQNIQKTVISSLPVIVKTYNSLPSWLKPLLGSLNNISPQQFSQVITLSPFPFVSGAFFGIINFFIFLFAAFFFLKDGKRMVERALLLVPNDNRVEITILLRRINLVLGGYLRGQIFLILTMTVMLFIVLSLLGAQNALTISLFTGIFEIIPFLGPVITTVFSVFLITISGGYSMLNLSLFQTIILTIVVFYAARMIQDYFITPYVIGRITKLHPLVILFSVLAGEHLYGILGVLLAVPIAATIKIIIEFISDKVNIRERKRSNSTS